MVPTLSTLAKVLRIGGVVVAAAGAWFVAIPHVYQVLIVFMGVDMVTGIFRASIQGALRSADAWRGTMKKAGEALVVALGVYLQQIAAPIGNVPLPEALCLFYIYTEGLSILENLAVIGVPVPDFLKNVLAELAPGKQSDGSGRAG